MHLLRLFSRLFAAVDIADVRKLCAACVRFSTRFLGEHYQMRRRAICVRSPKRQRGASMLEFSLVALPLLLLGVLVVEAAHWHVVRQLAYVALLDSARAGATQQGQRDVMERTFAQAILPRFVYAGGTARERRDRMWQRVQRQADMPAWWIEILRPDEPHGLTTRLTYLHEPLTPLARALLRQIARLMDGCARHASARGFLAMRLDLHIERHSPPIDWRAVPASRHDRIIYRARDCSSSSLGTG